MKNSIVKRMTICGLLASVAIVLDYISFKNNFDKITLYPIAIILASLLFNIKYGLLTGIVAGFISQVICYGISPTTILWMIPYVLWGILPVCFVRLFKIKDNRDLILPLLISAFIITSVNTGISYLDGLVYQYPVEYTLSLAIYRFGKSLIFAVIYYYIIFLIKGRIDKVKRA